jgi:hypothetical protein
MRAPTTRSRRRRRTFSAAARGGEVVIVEALATPAEPTPAANGSRSRTDRRSRSRLPTCTSRARRATSPSRPASSCPAGASCWGSPSTPAGTAARRSPCAYGTRLALNNDAEEISLCLGTCADGTVIDRAGWKALGGAYDGHALVFDRATRTGPAPRRRLSGPPAISARPARPMTAAADPDAGF